MLCRPWQKWLRFQSQARRCRAQRRRFFSPRLEVLEERALLSGAGMTGSDPKNTSQSTQGVASDGSTIPANFSNWLPPQHRLADWRGFLSDPAAGDPLDIALAFLNAHAQDLGLTSADLAGAVVTDRYADADTGTTHMYLGQTVNGLRVADVAININVTADGRVINVGSDFVPGLGGQQFTGGFSPALTGVQALEAAADSLGLISPAPPTIVKASADRSQSLVVSAPAFSKDDIPIQLFYVPSPQGGVTLAWHMVLRTPDGQHWLDLGVDANNGSMIFNVDWTDHASYNVFPRPIEAPNDGSRSIVTDPQDATASPYGWHDTDGTSGAEFTDTRGNNVSAQEDADADDSGGYRPDGGASLNFDFPLDLGQEPDTYVDASITNLFYWCNLLHDIHYIYGFNEAAGNFQVNNYGRGGAGNDAVQADAQDGSGTDNANFATPPDGTEPRMQQYIFTITNPNRDSSLDSEVIVHEYGHGVSNRLTGGPSNSDALDAIQSGAMGEGWSDWWSLMFDQKPTDGKMDGYGVGTYVLGEPTTGAGIRIYPYSFDMSIDPHTLADFNSDNEVHDAGEIWCSALWDMNWLLIDKYGFNPDIAVGYTGAGSAGNILALQLVMDALKLQPANPSFLDARDAILLADNVLTGGANQREIWTTFARRGMGLSASDSNANATTVVEAFDVPNFGMEVQSSAPAAGSVVAAPPTDFVINFSDAYDAATVDAADLIVNGVPANSFTLTDADTLTFHYSSSPVTAQGLQTMAIALDSIRRQSDNDGVSAFGAAFRYDALLMQVISTDPADTSVVTLPMTTLQVNFNEAYDPASIGTDDLTLSQGTVTGFTLIDADTVEYALDGIVNEDPLNVGMAAGAVTDIYGNPAAAYSGSFVLDIGTVAYPAPLQGVAPAGSLIYDPSVNASVSFVGDLDSFTLEVDAGQTLTVVAGPGATLQPVIFLTGPGVSTAAGTAAPGDTAVLQTVTLPSAGIYTITVTGLNASAGTYALHAYFNAALENEEHGGPSDDSLATAQNIDASFVGLGGTSARGGVLGASVLSAESEPNDDIGSATDTADTFAASSGNLYQLAISGTVSSNGDGDWFAIGNLQAGDLITITQSGSPSSRGTLDDPLVELYRGSASSPTLVIDNDDDGPGFDSLIYRFTVGVTDTYYIHAQAYSSEIGTYQLGVWLENVGTPPATGGSLTSETENNNAPSAANNASTSWRPVQYLSRTVAQITANDTDVFRYQFNAGDVITVNVDPTSSLFASAALLDSGGNVLALEDGTSFGPDGNSPLYAFRIPATGTYYLQVQSAAGVGTYHADVYLSAVAPPPALLGADYYSFSLAAGTTVSLAVKGLTAGGLNLELLGTGGATLAVGNAGATNVDRVISNFSVTTSGTYYARVSGAFGADYSLVVTRNASFDTEANNSLAAAQDLTLNNVVLGAVQGIPAPISSESEANDDRVPGGSSADLTYANDLSGSFVSVGGSTYQAVVEGTISAGHDGDWDFFKIMASPGDLLTVALNGLSLDDPYLHLFDNTGAEIAFDDDGGGGLNSLLTFSSFAYTGDYYIVADSFDVSTGSYILTATLTTTSPLDGANDDYYSIAVVAGNVLTIETATPSGGPLEFANNLDPVIELYNPSGASVALNDNGAPDIRNAFLTYVTQDTGLYTVRVCAVGGSRGEYLLHVVGANNHAPVLDNTGAPALPAISEDPASNPGMLVTALLASGAGGDPIGDADDAALEGIAITAVNNSNGSWEFSIDDGTNWASLGTPSDTSARLLAADSATRIRFVPSANFNGTVAAGITFHAWDQTTGTNGGTANTSSNGGHTAFSTAVETAAITVTEVNDGPTGIDDALSSIPQDSGDRIIPFATLLQNDLKGPANENSQMLTIIGVGNAVGGAVSLVGNNVIFSPATFYIGPAGFTYTLQDNGTTNGSNDFLTDTATVTFTIFETNDPPFRTGGTITNLQVNEFSSTVSLGLGGLTYSPGLDPTESGQTLTYQVTSLPPANIGTVRLSDNTPVIASGTYTLSQIHGMMFSPADNGSGTFAFTVRDNGTTNGVNDFRTVTELMTITVVNVAPTVTASGNGSVNEGSPYAVTLGSVIDPAGSNDTVTSVVVHWGDGQQTTFNAGNPLPPSRQAPHTYANGAFPAGTNFNITVDLTDEDGTYLAVTSKPVTVLDVAPAMTATGNSAVNEGSAYTLTLGAVVDPGQEAVTSITVHWGDGQQTVFNAGNPLPASRQASHVYADGAAAGTLRNIAVDVQNVEAAFLNVAAASLTVDNVAPTLPLSGNSTANEGQPYTLTLGSVVDPGQDTVSQVVVHWGDGGTDTFDAGNPLPPTRKIAHTYDNGAPETITVDLTDEDGAFLSAASKALNVLNVAPSIDLIAADGIGVRGQTRTVTVAATDAAGDMPAGLGIVISWGDGRFSQGTTFNSQAHAFSHVYTSAGSFTISATATDLDNLTSFPATSGIEIESLTFEGSALAIGGGDGADTISLYPDVGNPGNVRVSVNGVLRGSFTMPTAFYAYGCGGDDVIKVLGVNTKSSILHLKVPAILDGGPGNDLLDVGSSRAANVLIGGPGNDRLFGSPLRDILIGGLGADILNGSGGQDILLGDALAFDADPAAVIAILNEWARTDKSYVQRVGHLTGTLNDGESLNGNYFLNTAAVVDDHAGDSLSGQGDRDWFFKDRGALTPPIPADKVTDFTSTEKLTKIL